jgi:hypothetical protein
MAVSDPIEWFQMYNPAHVWGDPFTHGIVEDKTTGEWIVVRKEFADALGDSMTKITEISRAPTRAGAIGILKLLKE